jgi:WhiB family transcriptional regulator, redox-sensing transcriptional regulator
VTRPPPSPTDEFSAGRRQYGVRTGDRCPEVLYEMIESTDPMPDQAAELLPADLTAWWVHARCNAGSGELTDVFFSGEPQDIARAKRLCLSCPTLIPCLEGALERREPWGVWGGQLFVDGTIVAAKRRRGRPPKVPRLEDQLPEVPLPEHLREVPVVRIA